MEVNIEQAETLSMILGMLSGQLYMLLVGVIIGLK